VAAGPFIASIYPEYLTDPNILICPSDSEAGETTDKLAEEGLQNNVDEADASYAYFGWVFDRLKGNVAAASTFNFLAIALGATGADLSQEVPVQLAAGLNELVQKPAVLQAIADDENGPNGMAAQNAADEDIDLAESYPGEGNGGGNVIYRFREGIERFLITDINNPAASAQAQSTVWVMLDSLGTLAATKYFNHIPGGCNVLYMDGHVDFVRYVNTESGATSPVLPSVATLVGAFTNID
jgi:prepilin-type processing-associated H-X9-DG protein